MTPGSHDIIILVTWSKLYISEMWRQQNYKLIALQTIYFWKLQLNTFLTMGQTVWWHMWFKVYGHFFFYKINKNYVVISQKVLTSLQKWSHGTNFGIVLCIKSYLY